MNSNQETSIQRTKIIKKRRFNDLIDYFGITIAVLMGTCGWLIFLLPNEISMGGVTGISSILYWGLKIPVDATYFTINAILLGLALKILGFKFCIKTIYAVAVMTVFIRLIKPIAEEMHLLSDHPFMAAILGASFIGISIGICLLCNGSTGGSDVVAAMVNKYHDISLGNIILMCDLGIITSSYFVLRDWEQVLYGYVVLFVTSFCVDNVINKARRSVQFFIISEKYEEIARQINIEAQRGCTLIDGRGFYSDKEAKLIFVLAKQNESSKIFQLIDEIDPNAFVSQSAVIGAYGLGFDRFKVKKGKKKQQMA